MPDLATSGASLTGVGWVYKDYCYALLQSLILNKLLELKERPGLMNMPLFLSYSRPLPDVFQVFHNKNISRVGTLNNPLTNDVVQGADCAALLARKLFQELFSPSRAFGLKGSSQIRKMPPYLYSLFAGEIETVGCSSNVVNPHINTNRISAFRLGDWFGKNDVDIKALLPPGLAINKSSRGRALPFKKMPLIVPYGKWDSDSTLDCGNRYRLLSRNIAENSLVIGNRGWLKFSNLTEPFFGRLGYSGNGSYSQIGCQSISLSYVSIAKMLELYLICRVVILRHLEHIIASMGKSLKGSSKSFNLLRASIKFTRDCLNKLHTIMNNITLERRHQGGRIKGS